MLFLGHGAKHKDAERHCFACGHQGLTAYVKASTSWFGVSEAALNIIFYRYERFQSINEFSLSQGFSVYEDDAFANFYLDFGAGIEEMIYPIARFAGFGASKQPQDLASTFLAEGVSPWSMRIFCIAGCWYSVADSISRAWDCLGVLLMNILRFCIIKILLLAAILLTQRLFARD